MPRTLVTPPGTEIVTLTEAKAHLRVTHTDEDALIASVISAAQGWVEDFTERALITQTWDYFLDAFPCEIVLPLPPLQSVTSVKYVDPDGVEQTLASSEYTVDTAAVNGIVRLGYGKSWPSTRVQANAVTVRFVAGYGVASAVPAAIKSACLLIIGELYARREHALVGAPIAVVPVSAEYLLWPYRSVRF